MEKKYLMFTEEELEVIKCDVSHIVKHFTLNSEQLDLRNNIINKIKRELRQSTLELTGNCLLYFKNWFKDTNFGMSFDDFKKLHDDFKWGVFQKFAESLGYSICVGEVEDRVSWYYKVFFSPLLEFKSTKFSTCRSSEIAMSHAIELFNKIYNENNK